MAVLTSQQRKGLRASVFGLPSQRKYPMPDASHAANAKARATQMYKRGRLTPAQHKAIFAKANRVMGLRR